ncbi:DUF427 domain-containing protein [Actinacidiphila glaucinigra]|uniref:Uncharacterized conserved protein, DUF427 family n=1 Tax=Actinacidiphila glaucinigra TaxID=235986 RepID=A0A239ND35_9ACTN|nr:DUF427 domain-containing protein [Actinacidiphila glaucinigra]SNT52422.1 Uncharacterized conserved protein, DUF427 family [Actinacidiphila glaucinigra]
MKAVVGETVVAEAASETVISIEGNAYFPPDSVAAGVLRESSTPYTCPWKGRAQYHDVVVGEMALRDAAWSYPDIKESAATRVGHDFSGYVAFDVRQVRIEI